MTKKEKIAQAIKFHEQELERLKVLMNNVDGKVLELCPSCKTKNYYWNLDNTWTCAFC
jgi:hypothetical protein